jgi:group I intron endonuclease
MQKLSELKRKELQFNGIYKIINIKNNKFYIGSCSSKSFLYERLKHHQQDLLNNKHCNKYLQNSFNKYSIEYFYFEIIEKCNSDICIEREQYWIDLLKPHYNLLKIAGSSFGRKCEQITREKIRKANKQFWENPENKEKMKNSFKNRKRTKIKSGYKNSTYKLSEKGKENLILSRSKKVVNNTTGIIYNSMSDLAKDLNLSLSSISMMIKGKRKNKFNLQWI